jgi:hypothetical protein
MPLKETTMSAITLDETLVKKLPSLYESTEIRDASGKVLGVYTPVEGTYYNQQIPQHILDQFDPSEMDKRRQTKQPGHSLKEVWEHIHAKEKQG